MAESAGIARIWIAGVAVCGAVVSTLTSMPAISGAHLESHDGMAAERVADKARGLELIRQNGDLKAQRRHVWRVVAQMTHQPKPLAAPQFEAWYGEDRVFSSSSSEEMPTGIRGFARASLNDQNQASSDDVIQSADAPILTYTLYNGAAYRHIRDNKLYLRAELELLRHRGARDSAVVNNRSVPTFPAEAVVLKTGWWPIAKDRLTALPVWDPEQNRPLRGGNEYIGWRRVVAVDPAGFRTGVTTPIEFAGRAFPRAHRVGLNAFYHVKLDAGLAKRIMRDRGAQKAASIALGRPLEEGDYIALVAANFATKEIEDWVWAAFWWHDRPANGPFAADRPREVRFEWRNYLMQVAFDAEKPTAVDGGPHIGFNPWFEARFPDGGHGGGTTSNCMTCHHRASYPPVNSLPVTRGRADLVKDPAYASGQLRTSFLWSLALHSTP